MLNLEATKGVELCTGITRRDFLRVGALAAGSVGLSLAELAQLQASTGRFEAKRCILLMLVGGPSQLDTWDPKPDAPDGVRGPFRPIPTNVPGIDIGEHFPRMARLADRYALIRSVSHSSAPIHETGHQLMQTGRLSRNGFEHPHYGSVVSQLRGRHQGGLPSFMILPGPIGNTGVSVSHGQSAGCLGAAHEPCFLQGHDADGLQLSDFQVAGGLDPARLKSRSELVDAVDSAQRAFDGTTQVEPAQETGYNQIFASRAKRAFDIAGESDRLRDRYGWNTFGQSCLLARRLVENGVRLVTVNMFDTVFNAITWDCHADGGALPATLDDYKEMLCPMFDLAYSALLEDLVERGLLEDTLVVAMGEFGRTPQLNARGGRDHWPGCWSILFAGAGVRGGQVIGASDEIAGEPKDRPVSPAEVAASVYKALGIDGSASLPGQTTPIVDGEPVAELFGK